MDEARLAGANRCASPRRRRSSLPHGDQREARSRAADGARPKVYMFDEPTAGMSVDEVPVILDLIRALKARKRTA